MIFMYEISVIVPIFNGEKNLGETLETLLAAGRERSLQIVLVNDGSTDQSAKICMDYQKWHTNICYYEKENEGIVSARNTGLSLAEGQYVCFCDQDDLVEPDFFEVMYQAISRNAADLIICGTNRYINGKKVICEQFDDHVYKKEEIAKGIVLPVLFYGTDLGRPSIERWVGSIWKCIISRHIIVEHQLRFRRYVNYEDDLLFYIDVLCHVHTAGTLSYVGYNWRINPKSETYNWKYIENFAEKYQLFIRDMLQMICTLIPDKEILNQYKKFQLCVMYDELISNEGSPYCPRKFTEKINYLKKDILKNGYSEAIPFFCHIRNTSIRKRGTLFFLKHHLWTMSYIWNISYKKIRERAIKNKTWFLLERKIKLHNGK